MTSAPESEFHEVCAEDDLWAGEMRLCSVAGVEVLLLRTDDGDICALQKNCPHQEHPLEKGEFDGTILTCGAHLWEFDAFSGRSVNPDDAELARYPVKVDGGAVLVSVEGIEPKHSHA
ncbi:Rieske 2Fe-2S domain-containing protein [Actinomadura decatromicini]|uniref:Rieske 2Fe-2S domain-containing protein n=1 Tax=Actinomadura decatromicini TaxID=2604572 RepID=A0A5D3FTJ4_9ACTN|nr:Rieske 2Fe-2S domain-containing protein [Actinomadura decatromicini]TYK51389.1 Rieske 2Fe-2S domain-containing protein [Actinomadura decatromicini]